MSTFKTFLQESQLSDLLNGKIESEKEFSSGQAAAQFRKFGEGVKSLVAKYEKFNATSDSVPTSSGYGNSTARASRSGKIEFADRHHTPGGTYNFARSGYYAVKLGSVYPKDKAEAFAKEYIALVKKQLPAEIPVGTKEKNEMKKTRIHIDNGTNYSTIMVTF